MNHPTVPNNLPEATQSILLKDHTRNRAKCSVYSALCIARSTTSHMTQANVLQGEFRQQEQHLFMSLLKYSDLFRSRDFRKY